jgi:hypothetical protein
VSENLAYALTQVLHNFGAAVVVGAPFFALWPTPRLEYARLIGWLVLVAWGVQVGSGVLFGAVSLRFYGQLPDLSTVALVALTVKVTAAFAGLLLAAVYLYRSRGGKPEGARMAFQGLFVLGVIPLTAAAFLRWFA